MLTKKLNGSESVKSLQIEKQVSNPIALKIDSIDVHNSSAVIELCADLNDIDMNLIDFSSQTVKSMLVNNQHDFEDAEADKIKQIIDNLGNDIDISNVGDGGIQQGSGNKNININKNIDSQTKSDFLSFNLEQTWKQNVELLSKSVKSIKDEYQNSINSFIRRFKYLLNRY